MSQQLSFFKEKKPSKTQGKVYKISSLPAFLPVVVADSLKAYLGTQKAQRKKDTRYTHNFVFSNAERKIFRRRKPINVSIWAERHRILEMSSIPGKWKNLFTPYLTGIMDAMGHSGIEMVIICKTPQCGGSEAGHNFVGWCIDRSVGPTMYVFPDEITARENAKDRIIPMLHASPRLREYLTGYSDDASSLRINLMHMPIYLGWSGSVSRLGNKPIRTLILDELDKYKNPKNEATSEVLAEKRTTTWRNRRHIVKISTPTKKDTSAIWIALTEEAEARFDYHVKCPHCGVQQLMEYERISFTDKERFDAPTGEDKEELLRIAEKVLAQKTAYYVCKLCGSMWADSDRDRAVRNGEWFERKTGLALFSHIALHQPIKIGFQIPAYLSYFVSLSEVAYAYMKSKATGQIEDLKNFMNQYLAEPWEELVVHRVEDEILKLCDDRPRGVVPGKIEGKERVSVLLATVDTQGAYFRYNIRAYGYGETEESWLIARGNAENFEALEQILFHAEYTSATGESYKVRAVMIDAMGGKTSQVYRWAVKHRGRVYPWQGVNALSSVFVPSFLEYYPSKKTGKEEKIKGGLVLYRCDVTFFKSDLSHKLTIHPDDPGAIHLHSNATNELNGYASEMCAEVWDDEKQYWINPKKRANHDWDCEVMQRALAYILNVRHFKPIPTRTTHNQKPQQQTISRAQSLRRRG